jgi:hypothetical protein
VLWPLGRRSYENNPGEGLKIQLAEQPVIVARVGVSIRRQDGGQPVLHVQLERGGDLRHMDAERPPQLSECAPEGPTMKAPVIGVVDAVAPLSTSANSATTAPYFLGQNLLLVGHS